MHNFTDLYYCMKEGRGAYAKTTYYPISGDSVVTAVQYLLCAMRSRKAKDCIDDGCTNQVDPRGTRCSGCAVKMFATNHNKKGMPTHYRFPAGTGPEVMFRYQGGHPVAEPELRVDGTLDPVARNKQLVSIKTQANKKLDRARRQRAKEIREEREDMIARGIVVQSRCCESAEGQAHLEATVSEGESIIGEHVDKEKDVFVVSKVKVDIHGTPTTKEGIDHATKEQRNFIFLPKCESNRFMVLYL